MKKVFEVDDAELKKIADWLSTLSDGDIRPIGGRITWSFTPTSLGIITVVSDSISGKEINVTDFRSW